MDVRVRFIRVQGERISMLTPELLAREISRRFKHLVGWRSGRRREHEFMDQLGRLSTFRRGECCLTPHVVDIEIPVIQERFSAATSRALAVIGFELEFSVAADVVEVFAHRLEVIAVARQYLYDCLWRSLNGSPYLVDLCVPSTLSRILPLFGQDFPYSEH